MNSNVAVTTYAQNHGTDLNGNPCTTVGHNGCGGCYPEGIPPSDPTAALLDQLTKINPEWAAIGDMIQTPDPRADSSSPPASNAIYMHGTVDLTKINVGGDFPGSHVGDDQNTFITLDPADSNRIATGNSENPTSCPGEGCGQIEMEWEFNKYPLFTWAGEGDRITALGRWIFDCGHPNTDPEGACSQDATIPCILDRDCTGTCQSLTCSNGAHIACALNSQCTGTCTNPAPTENYRAELHPPKAVAIIRNKSIGAGHKDRTAPAIPATRADVYVNADGGGASDRCVDTHFQNPNDILFFKTCFLHACYKTTDAPPLGTPPLDEGSGHPCNVDKDCPGGETCRIVDPYGNLAQINADDFVFDMPLPTAPTATSTLKVTTKNRPKPKGSIRLPKALITPMGGTPATSLHVVVPMSTALPSGKFPNVFAQTISAGWKDDLTSLWHVQVKFKSLTINNPLKSATPAIPRYCTDPAAGFLLPPVSCTTDDDCPVSTCVNSGKPCHNHHECGKTDTCNSPSLCLGGLTPGWNLWSQVNGDWVGFKKIDTIGTVAPFPAPPFVVPPTPVPLAEKFTFNEFVPGNGSGTIHIASTGNSRNCLDTLYATNVVNDLATYGFTSGGACLSAGSLNPGRLEVNHTIDNAGGLSGVTGATCTPSGPQLINTLVTCNTTSVGGDAGTCASHPNNLCVEDNDCAPGTCSTTLGPCHTASQCKHCSGSGTFCSINSDCPTGTCANDGSRHCNNAGDCIGTTTCTGGQTCVSGAETCNGSPESCTVSGGAFTLTYTIQVKP